jgi:hypothetical protein
VNNSYYLPLLLHRSKRRNLIKFSKNGLLHITIATRKESLINLQKKFPNNPKGRLLNLLSIFPKENVIFYFLFFFCKPKENVLIVKNQDILPINAKNHLKRLNKRLVL